MSCCRNILERTSDVVQCKEIDKGVRNVWRWEWLEGEADGCESLGDSIQNVCNVCNFLLVHAVCQEPIKDAKCHQMPWFASKNLQIFLGGGPPDPPTRGGTPPLILSPCVPSVCLWAFGPPFQNFLTSSNHISEYLDQLGACLIYCYGTKARQSELGIQLWPPLWSWFHTASCIGLGVLATTTVHWARCTPSATTTIVHWARCTLPTTTVHWARYTPPATTGSTLFSTWLLSTMWDRRSCEADMGRSCLW